MLLFFVLHWVTLRRYLLPWSRKAAQGLLNGLSVLFSHSALLLYSLDYPIISLSKTSSLTPNNWLPKNWPFSLFLMLGKETQPAIFLFTPLLCKNKNNHIEMSNINFKCANVGQRHLLSGRILRNVDELLCSFCVKCSGHNSN